MKQLLRNQILFKPFPSDEVTESGLLIPETAREINNKGVIVKVAAGNNKRPMNLKEGDVVYKVKDWGELFIINNEKYFLMDASAILAKD